MSNEQSFNRVQWAKFKNDFKAQYGEQPSVISTLFVVGLGEINSELSTLSKEEKQDVIHVGLCTILEQDGVYKKTHTDEQGWPHFTPTKKAQQLDIEKQEIYLRQMILNYFNYV